MLQPANGLESLVAWKGHGGSFHQPQIIEASRGAKTRRRPVVMDTEQRLFPLMGFRMSVREGQAARAVVIRGRAIAPLTRRGAWLLRKYPSLIESGCSSIMTKNRAGLEIADSFSHCR